MSSSPIININFLAHRRIHFLDSHVKLLSQLRNKDKIQFSIIGSSNDQEFLPFVNRLNDAGIQTAVHNIPGGHYMSKIRRAISQDFEYSIKADEDCFLNPYTLDFLIDNVNVLEDPSLVLLAPTISNGIPGYDYAARFYFTEDQVKEIEKRILKTALHPWCGVDYTYLNKHTVEADRWDCAAFYDSVRQLNHHYKGIHPVRLNPETQNYINDIILSDFSKWMHHHPNLIVRDNSPYLCNSYFVIKTSTWRDAVLDTSLSRDDYDEVNINLYKEINNKNFAFIANGLCIHSFYNHFGDVSWNSEARFYERFSQCLESSLQLIDK